MKSLVEFQGGVVRCRVWWSSEDLTKGEHGVGVEIFVLLGLWFLPQKIEASWRKLRFG